MLCAAQLELGDAHRRELSGLHSRLAQLEGQLARTQQVSLNSALTAP
jgi:hypothetical protein